MRAHLKELLTKSKKLWDSRSTSKERLSVKQSLQLSSKVSNEHPGVEAIDKLQATRYTLIQIKIFEHSKAK
jgi:hypothetical protein